MTEQEIKDIVTRQRKYFQTGATLPVSSRLAALQNLYHSISGHEAEIHDALKKDLGKSGFESYMCETGMVLEEISYMLKHTPKFAREQRVRTPLAQFHSRSYKKPSPYGACRRKYGGRKAQRLFAPHKRGAPAYPFRVLRAPVCGCGDRRTRGEHLPSARAF